MEATYENHPPFRRDVIIEQPLVLPLTGDKKSEINSTFEMTVKRSLLTTY